MSRYRILSKFFDFARAHDHLKISCLYEVRQIVSHSSVDPPRSCFGSNKSLSEARSAVFACDLLPAPVDYALIAELDTYDGIDSGEALLIEYAFRSAGSYILTAERKFLVGLHRRPTSRITKALEQRVVHVERVIWEMFGADFDEMCARIRKDPGCDTRMFETVERHGDVGVAALRFEALVLATERLVAPLLRAAV